MTSVNTALSQPTPKPADATPAETLLDRFDAIVEGAAYVFAVQCDVELSLLPLCVLFCVRLIHLGKRFGNLWTRWREGRLLPPRQPPSQPIAPRKRPVWPAALIEPRSPLPRSFGWLLKLVPQAAMFNSQLQRFLVDPEMVAFLTEVPQAGRLLRSLCHTLGIPLIPELLRLQPAKPRTPPPQPASPEQPGGEPPTADTPAEPARPGRPKTPDPTASSTHAGDPLWARPVALWCNPPRR